MLYIKSSLSEFTIYRWQGMSSDSLYALVRELLTDKKQEDIPAVSFLLFAFVLEFI